MRDRGDRQTTCHEGARAIGVNFQRAAELPESFPHATNAYSGRAGGSHFLDLLRRDAFTLVLDFDKHDMIALAKPNLGDRTLRVAVNIGQAFLHHAKNGSLRFTRQPLELVREIEIDVNLAATNKSLDI